MTQDREPIPSQAETMHANVQALFELVEEITLLKCGPDARERQEEQDAITLGFLESLSEEEFDRYIDSAKDELDLDIHEPTYRNVKFELEQYVRDVLGDLSGFSLGFLGSPDMLELRIFTIMRFDNEVFAGQIKKVILFEGKNLDVKNIAIISDTTTNKKELDIGEVDGDEQLIWLLANRLEEARLALQLLKQQVEDGTA